MPKKAKGNPKTTGEDDNDTNGRVEESVVEADKEDTTTVVQEEDGNEGTIVVDNGSFVQDQSPVVKESTHRNFTPSAAYLASQVCTYLYLYLHE